MRLTLFPFGKPIILKYYILTMGIFITYSDKNEISEVIHSFIKEEGSLTLETDELASGTFIAKGEVSNRKANVTWNIEPLGSANSVRMKLIPEKTQQAAILFRTLFFAVTLGILPHFFSKYWNGTSNSSPILKIAILVFMGAGFLWMNDNRYKNILNKLESRFRIKAKASIGIKIESPPDAKFFPISFDLIISIILAALFMFVAYNIFPLLFYIWLPVMALSVLFMILSRLANKDNYLIWKTLLVSYVFKWILLTCSIIYVFFVLYIFNSYYFIYYENIIHGSNISYTKIISTDYFYRTLKEIKKQPSDSTKYKINTFYEAAEELYKNADWEPTKEDIESLARKLSLKTGFIGLLSIIISLFAVLAAVNSFEKIPEEWRLFLAEGNPTALRVPAVGSAAKIAESVYRILLWLWASSGFIINIIFAILSIDVIYFILFSRTLIIKELSALISWIPTIFITLAKAKNPSNVHAYDFMTNIILIYFASPFIYVILRWIGQIFRTKKYHSINVDLSNDIRSKIKELCKKINIKEPIIEIVIDKNVIIEAKAGLFSHKALIAINKTLIDKLTGDEILAIIAHELSHIKNDLKKIAALKILSRMMLYPNFFLTLFVNYKDIEEKADAFSINATNKPEELKNALIKISAWAYAEAVSKIRKTDNIRKKSRFAVVNEFFFGDALIGYSHPGMIDRIKTIEKYCNE